jgi:O-antigen/teichoic acid export membrane protein
MAVHGRGILGSITWSAVSTIGAQFISFLVFAILARILGSREFGLVALAALVVDLMQVVSAGGLAEAVIQRPNLQDEEADTAFWLNVLSGLIFFTVGLAVVHPIANAFHQPALSKVLNVLCLLFLITPIGGVHQAIMMRNLDFKGLAYRNILANTCSGVVGVGMAFAGFGVWALVAQRLCAAVALVVLVWFFSGWKPQRRFEIGAVRKLLSFGLNLMFSQLLVQLNARTVEIITGASVGPSAVAFIRAGSRCVDTLSQVTFTPFHQVVLPLQARVAGDVAATRATYGQLSRTSSIIMFPAFFGLMAVAGPLVLIIFGSSWAPSADAIQIVAITVLPLQFNVLMLSSLAAAGRPRVVLAWSIVQVLVGVSAIVASAHLGWRWMLVANVARSYALLPIGFFVLFRATGIGPWLVLRSMGPAAVSASLMGAALIACDRAALTSMSAIPRLAILVGLGAALYVTLGLLLDRKLITEAKAFFRLRSVARA